MKRYYLAVGYPLTYAIDRPAAYIIEQMEGTVAVTTEELKEWTNCLRVIATEGESQALRSLVRKGAVYDSDSLEGLLEAIRGRNAIRQGFGFLHEKKYAIMLGKECWYPSRSQLVLWSSADGCVTVEGLLQIAAQEGLTKMQAFQTISILMQNDSLYLR